MTFPDPFLLFTALTALAVLALLRGKPALAAAKKPGNRRPTGTPAKAKRGSGTGKPRGRRPRSAWVPVPSEDNDQVSELASAPLTGKPRISPARPSPPASAAAPPVAGTAGEPSRGAKDSAAPFTRKTPASGPLPGTRPSAAPLSGSVSPAPPLPGEARPGTVFRRKPGSSGWTAAPAPAFPPGQASPVQTTAGKPGAETGRPCGRPRKKLIKVAGPATSPVAGRKPGARDGDPGPEAGASVPQDAGPTVSRASAGGRTPPVPVPRLPWPAWEFPPMCGALETLRSKAEKAREDRDSEGALTAWEDLRTLARVVHGPSDIRVWASLSRVARALLERGGDRADAAASLAAGAVRLMTEAAEAALPAPEALPVSVASPGQDALPAAGDSSGQDASAASDSSPGQEAFPAAGDLPGQDASTAADAAHGPEDSNGSDASSISEAAFGSGASDALPAPEGSNACDAVSGSEDSDFPDTAFYQEEPPGPDDDSGREESACPAYVAVPGPEMAFAYQTLSMALDQLRASPPEWRQDSETSADSGISPAAQPPSSVASGTEPSVNGTSGAVPSVNGTSGAVPSVNGTSAAVPSVNGTSAAEPSVTVSCGDGGPAPAFTLAEALWPVPVSEDEPARYPFEWAQNDPALMRSRFADTARIHGARSQQAQVARSILGEALAVAGKPEHAAEARELLKTSSDELGHSRLSGSADVPDSMARYARLLSGCLGPAPLLFPRTGLPSSINELRRSAELYREIQHTLASGPFMTRRRLAATLGEARALTALGRHREAADILRLKNSNPPDAVAGTRVRLSLMFDTAETYLTDWEFDPETAWGWHARCAFGRLERLGARHRDTAASMARLADVAAWCEAPTVKAAALRARAAEILGRLGGPDALLVPDLTARIAWDLMKLDEHATAAELLARAIPGLAPSGSDRFPQVPEALVMAGQACFRAGDREGARAAFSRAGYLLDGNHSRSPVPEKYRKELYAEVQLGLAKIEVEGHPSADAECAGASGEPVPAEASGASWLAGPAEARGNSWRPGAYEASGAQGLPEPDESGTFAAPEPPPPPAFPARPAFPEIPPAVTAEDSALEKPLSFHLMDSSSRGNWEAISRAAAEDAARKKAREAAGIPMRPRRPKKRFSTRPSGRA